MDAHLAGLTGLNVLNGDGDGVPTWVVVALFVLVAASPFVLGLALRLADRRRPPADPGEHRPGRLLRPWSSLGRPERVAVILGAAALGLLVATLVG